MKYFFDTEFIEDGKTIDLISIGIVSEDERLYYACNNECDLSRAGDWVKENVLVYLPPKHEGVNPGNPDVSPSIRGDILTWKTKNTIKQDVIDFIGDDNPEFWAYYADYDWVVFCQLFGTMMDLPKNFPMYCKDLKQELDRLNITELPSQPSKEHHALVDAQWNYEVWRLIQGS